VQEHCIYYSKAIQYISQIKLNFGLKHYLYDIYYIMCIFGSVIVVLVIALKLNNHTDNVYKVLLAQIIIDVKQDVNSYVTDVIYTEYIYIYVLCQLFHSFGMQSRILKLF